MGTKATSEDPDEMSRHVTFHQGLHCLLRKNEFSSDSEDPDEMSRHAAFHQGLHCLLRKTE